MEEKQSSPQELPIQIKREEAYGGRGHLKIFFGYAAGVGKTYAMLQAARTAMDRGIDVVVGYADPHARPQTIALLEGMEQLPVKREIHGEDILREFDLDLAMKRKPGLILVDELAHTNADGCRHKKRYQDINELLRNGIDVYTTVNVQHIESLNDQVAEITGVTVAERIPDSVFDEASQVELVDIEPEELIERLNEGKVYGTAQAQKAAGDFFTVQNLVALRELALRRCADRVNKISIQTGAKGNDYFTEEHILVCLSPSPTNAKIIRTAARMASAFKGGFTALFVETKEFNMLPQENKERLRQNIHLAEQLGATIETMYGEDIAFQISEFARLCGVSKIVLGRSSRRRGLWFNRLSLTERITQFAPNIDIYVIPDKRILSYRAPKYGKERPRFNQTDVYKSAAALMGSTAVGFFFFRLGFSEANIITVYILGVLVTAVITSERLYSLMNSIISVLLFNFIFTEPRFTFNAYDRGYPATFLIMFAAAFMTSSLAVRIKRQAKQSAETAYRTKIMFDTNRMIGAQSDAAGIISVTCNQLSKLLDKHIFYYGVQQGNLTKPLAFSTRKECISSVYTSKNERAVAHWVYCNNKHAGATTGTLGGAQCLYLSIRVGRDVYGVIGIAIDEAPLDALENSIMLSILGECALALKNEEISKEREEAALLAKNEQMRANLLRSISHDLRTPLTSISGNAGILLSNEEHIGQEKRRQLYTDIYDDALWLINLVENLLSVTRIEDGTMKLTKTPELLCDIVAEALQHTDRRRDEHRLKVKAEDDFLFVRVDARLIMQVLINLIDNAVKYTQKGSVIQIETRREKSVAVVCVSDSGNGISNEDKEHIFDMFYTANARSADSRRSLGLGLALCKSIITAHGGDIKVTDRKPHGAAFTFTLPVEEVEVHA